MSNEKQLSLASALFGCVAIYFIYYMTISDLEEFGHLVGGGIFHIMATMLMLCFFLLSYAAYRSGD